MTLEEAIKHAEEMAEREHNNAQVYDKIKNNNLYHPDKITCKQAAKRCRECAADYRQLAEWLKELKAVHEAQDVPGANAGDMISRQGAVESLCNVFSHAGCDNCKYNDGSICCEECTISKYTNWSASEIVISKALDDVPDTNVGSMISRQAAIDALWKALYAYEDETEKKFQENEELNLTDWFLHRIFVQNMSDIDRQTILALPSVTPKPRTGKWMGNVCTACGKPYPYSYDADYCPNCGAKMEG